MEKDRIKGYQIRIDNSKDTGQINKILKEILEAQTFPDELILSVLNAINSGHFIDQYIICEIISKTKSYKLYDIAEQKIGLSYESLAKILRSGFFRPEIEHKLCQALYQCFLDDTFFLRRDIVDALNQNGMSEAFEMLKVIEEELSQSIQNRTSELDLNELLSDSNSSPENVILIGRLSCAVDFLERVREAKSNVAKRLHDFPTKSRLTSIKWQKLTQLKWSSAFRNFIDEFIKEYPDEDHVNIKRFKALYKAIISFFKSLIS